MGLSEETFIRNKKINLLTFGYLRECLDELNLSNNMPLSLHSLIFEFGRWSGYEYDEDDIVAKKELDYLLSTKELQHVPLLVFANKQDLPNALSVNEVTKRLELNKILQTDRKWHIGSAQATNGDGLYEGM